MKRLVNRVTLVTLVSVSLALGTSTLASAQAPQTPQQRFQAALRLYNHDLFMINAKFKAAIGNDKAIEMAALAAAKSPAQKYLARVDFNEARAKSKPIIAPDANSEELITSLLLKVSKMFESSKAAELDLNPIILHNGTYHAVDLRIIE